MSKRLGYQLKATSATAMSQSGIINGDHLLTNTEKETSLSLYMGDYNYNYITIPLQDYELNYQHRQKFAVQKQQCNCDRT